MISSALAVTGMLTISLSIATVLEYEASRGSSLNSHARLFEMDVSDYI
jgi:hypothetical protein